jgi:polyvinyl alcohol dehydrogenase (cytochrome)
MRHIAVLSIIFTIAFSSVTRNGLLDTGEIEGHAGSRTFTDTMMDKGKKVFQANCSACHKDSGFSLAPGITIMSAMTPRAIFASLKTGKMRQQGLKLSDNERIAVAQWLTRQTMKTTEFPKDAYTKFSLTGNKHQFDHSGWGNNKEGTGFRTATQAGINPENVGTLKLKWAFAFPDGTVTRSKPAIVGDWLIIGGQYGEVFAINQQTGKIGWTFTAGAAIRGGIAVSVQGNSITAYFADFTTNVYAVDVKTGKALWTTRAGFDVHSSVSGTVAVYGGRIFVPISSLEVAIAASQNYTCCISSGGLVAIDALTGKKLWSHRVVPRAKESGKTKKGKTILGPSGAPVWCSPTVDAKRGLVYIGTGQNYSYPSTETSDAIQALDMKTGKLVWNFQATKGDMYTLACPYFETCPDIKSPDFDFGMAPLIVKRKDGKEILVVGQKAGIVHALTPDGKVIWQTRVGKGGMLGGVHWGMATDGEFVYAANSDNKYAVNKDDSTIKATPGIHAINLETGQVAWYTAAPDCGDRKNCVSANSAAPMAIPGLVFAGALDGHIRAYSSSSGQILWDFDTVRDFETTNGVKGKGGAIDGPAPVVANGMLFVNSGYGMFGSIPGNVLLAFEIDRK